jgi:hypothetical protein
VTTRWHATLRRSKPVRRVRQGPLPNAVQLALPTDFGFSDRRGRDPAETARAKTNNGNADKADESKPAHDKFPSWAAFEHASKRQPHFIDELDLAVVARWSSLSEEAIEKKARDILKRLSEANDQLPADVAWIGVAP